MNYIIANNIRSVFNTGSLFRVADSVDSGLILQGITPHPRIPNDKRPKHVIEKNEKFIKKAAVKTFDHVKFEYFESIKEVLSFLNAKKLNLYVIEEGIDDSKNLFEVVKEDIKSPYAVLVGSEVDGVDKEFVKRADSIFYIPMYGKNNSINVSVACGIASHYLKNL